MGTISPYCLVALTTAEYEHPRLAATLRNGVVSIAFLNQSTSCNFGYFFVIVSIMTDTNQNVNPFHANPMSYVLLTFWFVSHVLEAKVEPANMVPLAAALS